VFEAEFYGSLNQDGEIPITDIEPEIFKMLLGYLYTSIPLDVKDKVRFVNPKKKGNICFLRILTVLKLGTCGMPQRSTSCLNCQNLAS
jgi:hypothetical protein